VQAEIECVVRSGDVLGEAPLWCDRTKRLWWIDVRRPVIQCYDAASGKHFAVRLSSDMTVGSIALREAGDFLLATNSGLYAYDPEKSEPPRLLADPEAPGIRLNDGRCDRRGRFWVGSMKDGMPRSPAGNFFRIDPDLSAHHQFDGVYLPNSVAFGADNKTLYFADTHPAIIWAFDFDLDDGVISNRRVFQDLSNGPGLPDGSAVDADNCLWNAVLGTGELVRYTPQGKVDRRIKLPVTHATCPSFGGNDLSTLYVTTHTQRMSPEEVARDPLGGSLFAVRAGVQGLPEARFKG
jgi:sugar lactone lactonase YvrE